MMTCECGFTYHPEEGEKSLSSMLCPKCKRKMIKGETWIKPLGGMNMLEAVKHNGRESKFLKERQIKNGF